MDVSQPNASPPSPEDKQELERLKQMIDRALADGWLSRQEREEIVEAAQADHKITEEELALLRMVQKKIWQGEIQIED